MRLSQEDNTRQQVHYLLPKSQNEFIKECSEKVLAKIKLEISDAKYYAVILDSTPDASHMLARNALKQLNEWNDCRGQGYDNGSNMSGIHNGVQAVVMRRDNEAALYSPCACHSLNLCGSHAAQCCSEVITFFGMVQKLYDFFSASPQRWEILQEKLTRYARTRWLERVTAVRPVAAHSDLILKSIEAVGELTLTPEATIELTSMQGYFSSFHC